MIIGISRWRHAGLFDRISAGGFLSHLLVCLRVFVISPFVLRGCAHAPLVVLLWRQYGISRPYCYWGFNQLDCISIRLVVIWLVGLHGNGLGGRTDIAASFWSTVEQETWTRTQRTNNFSPSGASPESKGEYLVRTTTFISCDHPASILSVNPVKITVSSTRHWCPVGLKEL